MLLKSLLPFNSLSFHIRNLLNLFPSSGSLWGLYSSFKHKHVSHTHVSVCTIQQKWYHTYCENKWILNGNTKIGWTGFRLFQDKLVKLVNLFTLINTFIIKFLCCRDIPVDMKYIADPTMHSMPAVTPSPNQKWLACQSMDNKIVIFSALNRFKMNRKKTFSGHMVAGYACTLDFSPDMRFVLFSINKNCVRSSSYWC